MTGPNVVTLPADLVQRPSGLPGSCSRHGRPAAKRVDFALQSKTQPHGGRLTVFGMADRLGQHAKAVRVTHVKGWPLCRTCVRTRAVWFTLSLVLFFGGLLAFAGSLVAGVIAEKGTVQWLAAVAVGGFLLMIVSAFPFSVGSLSRVTGARTSADGESVIVAHPSDAFTAELPLKH